VSGISYYPPLWFYDLGSRQQNTATNFVQTSIITKKDCLDRMAKLEKLKLTSKRFYIAGYGECFTKSFGSGNPCPKVDGFPEAEKIFNKNP
jgi:hypothetical protein